MYVAWLIEIDTFEFYSFFFLNQTIQIQFVIQENNNQEIENKLRKFVHFFIKKLLLIYQKIQGIIKL